MKPELHKTFCLAEQAHRVHRTILKSIAQVESSWMPRAYRFEPEFFKRLKEREPYWSDKDPSIVSASYGYMQILFTTAWSMDLKPSNWKTLKLHEFQALAEKIYEPRYNIMLGARLMRQLIDKVWSENLPWKFEDLSAVDIALARYNGGSHKNPDTEGNLRNQKYVDKVWRAWDTLNPKEEPLVREEP